MIKAAFFDIDGTLLSFRTHRVSAGTIEAFDRLHHKGIRTFLSTGRPQMLIPQMPVQFDARITMNGGLVFNDSEVLASHPIPREDSEAWLDYAKANNVCTMIFTKDTMLAAQVNATALAIRQQLEFEMPQVVDIEAMRGQEVYQIIAMMPPEADEEVGRLMSHCRLPRWHNAFTDIGATGISKASGMAAICQHYGIAQAETIAFGDGGNDIEMLQWAGIGIAMGNAAQEVKKAADMITTDVDNEGIAHAINELLD